MGTNHQGASLERDGAATSTCALPPRYEPLLMTASPVPGCGAALQRGCPNPTARGAARPPGSSPTPPCPPAEPVPAGRLWALPTRGIRQDQTGLWTRINRSMCRWAENATEKYLK